MDHYQLEDGSGNYQLEDGGGSYLLEQQVSGASARLLMLGLG